MLITPRNYEEECQAYRDGKLAGEPVFEKEFDMKFETLQKALLFVIGISLAAHFLSWILDV